MIRALPSALVVAQTERTPTVTPEPKPSHPTLDSETVLRTVETTDEDQRFELLRMFLPYLGAFAS